MHPALVHAASLQLCPLLHSLLPAGCPVGDPGNQELSALFLLPSCRPVAPVGRPVSLMEGEGLTTHWSGFPCVATTSSGPQPQPWFSWEEHGMDTSEEPADRMCYDI